MVEIINGNMLHCEEQTFTIPVNLIGTAGSGLALYFKLKYKEQHKDYVRACRTKLFYNNQLLTVPIGNGKRILLFPTKTDWREDSSLTLIEHYLKILARDYVKLRIESLALPLLGCGLGNLDNNDVIPLIEKYLGPLDLNVKIYI